MCLIKLENRKKDGLKNVKENKLLKSNVRIRIDQHGIFKEKETQYLNGHIFFTFGHIDKKWQDSLKLYHHMLNLSPIH